MAPLDDWLTHLQQGGQLSTTDALALLGRQTNAPPPWLALALQAARQPGTVALDAVLDATPHLGALFEQDDWLEPPASLLRRCALQVAHGWRNPPGTDGLVPAMPAEFPAGACEATLALRDTWLANAAARSGTVMDGAQRWPLPVEIPHPHQVQLPVLLLDPLQAGHGIVARIRLWRVPAADAALRLVPAPCSATLPQTRCFADALGTARHCILAMLGLDAEGPLPSPLQDQAIAWDLAAEQATLYALDGDSAGASFTLGALWLLRGHASGPLQGALAGIDRLLLRSFVASAAVDAAGCLYPVGGITPTGKPDALRPLAQALRNRPGDRALLHLSHQQPGTEVLMDMGLRWQGHDDLLKLAQAAQRASGGLPPALLSMHEALLADGPPAQSGGQAISDEVLLHAARHSPVRTLRDHALRQWARWEVELPGHVQAHFVALDVKPDAAGPLRPRINPSRVDSLHKVLTDHDALGHDAYVLRGAPGAGKTTLLLHHLQGLCRQALQGWARGQTPAELPVYLPLADLEPGETDIAAWALRSLRADGAPDGLLELLQPAIRSPDSPRLRLLLDGLNELRAPAGTSQQAQAAKVVKALQSAFLPPHDRLPMLLTIREHHIDQLAGLFLLHVDVLPWAPNQVQRYLQLRFPDPPAHAPYGGPPLPPWPSLWPGLQADPRTLELCGNPLHLVGQCELFEAGCQHAMRDRAALFTALLWQRLRRELGYSPHQRKTTVDALWAQHPWLLGPQDHQAIAAVQPEHWRDAPPADLPMQGALLPALMAQAEAQWWKDADDGQPADKRCGVGVRWTQVRWGGVPEAQRLPLAQAAALLDLVRFSEARNSFRFRHQAWGEWLASRRLLAAEPPELRFNETGKLLASHPPGTMPAADWQRLLQHLARRPFERRDVDEIRHLAAANTPAWAAVPQAVWQGLLCDGLQMPVGQLLHTFLGPKHDGEDDVQRLQRLLTKEPGWFEGDTPLIRIEGSQCRLNLGLFGSKFGQPAILDVRRNWLADGRPQAWQYLAHTLLPNQWRHYLWLALQGQIRDEQLAALQAEAGRLTLPPSEPVDEVLGLAVLGLADPRPWLEALLAASAWAALQSVWPVLQAWLEPQGARGQQAPDALLQHLRRLLLLHSLDAGDSVLKRLQASGCMALLQQPMDGVPPLLHAHWRASWVAAFQGQGLDLRSRLQAGELLGRLGDNLRYRWVRVNVHGQGWREGLQLHPTLWKGRGRPGECTEFRIGSDETGRDGEHQAFDAPLEHFEIATYPVTVAEWKWFWQDPRCCDAAAPWWQAAGPAARRWLTAQAIDVSTGRLQPPPALNATGYDNGLQPITALTHWQALAFAAWASGLYQDLPAPPGTPAPKLRGHGWYCLVPTELQWEAGVRNGTCTAPAPADAESGAVAFNHEATRWGRPSPVGVFGLGLTADGLADTAGNVWEWCSNALNGALLADGYRTEAGRVAAYTPASSTDNTIERALRGGAFYNATDHCRPASRYRYPRDDYNLVIGVRLVRLWLPLSGHWKPSD